MNLQKQQELQHQHDVRHHFDIVALSRIDRLKHYGLHFAKYAGRFARAEKESKSRTETIVDALLVCLSAANALNQRLPEIGELGHSASSDIKFTDYMGRFADACEKIDHLEEFRQIALNANLDILSWLVSSSEEININIEADLSERRRRLASRVVYIAG